MQKYICSFFVSMMLTLVVVSVVDARETLVFSTFENSGVTLVLGPILREVYNRLGFDIEIREYPGARAIYMANEGEVDGEVARHAAIQKDFPNLVMVPVPLFYQKTVVFTKNADFSVQGWESLRPYSAVTLRGFKNTEKTFKDYGIDYGLVNTFAQIFITIEAGRYDIGILTMLDGLKTLNELQMKDFKILEPPLSEGQSYHFVHKKHQHLVPQIAEKIQELRDEGFIEQIERKVIADLTSN